MKLKDRQESDPWLLTRTKPLYSAVRDYLGVTADHLNISRRGSPLQGNDLLMSAARDSMYLLELKRFLQHGLQLPVRRATKIAMEARVVLSDKDRLLEMRMYNAHIVHRSPSVCPGSPPRCCSRD